MKEALAIIVATASLLTGFSAITVADADGAGYIRSGPQVLTAQTTYAVPVPPEETTAPAVPEAVKNGGRGVRIAVLDTGIDTKHPFLKVAGGASFIEGTGLEDDNGHGTMVAGVIAAVAPGAEIYSLKVLDKDRKGEPQAVAAALEWAMENRMQVVNMSFGTAADLPTLRPVIERAAEAGIVLVGIAGNESTEIVAAPARYGPVIAVGAVDKNNIRAWFSNTGAELELVAPGVEVLSTCMGGGYATQSGTSLAAALVSGTAALLLEDGPRDYAQVRMLLRQGAQDLGQPGRDHEYGFGLITPARSLALARA